MAVHKLIILRHGESEYNNQSKFCGWIDAPLSAQGKQEAIKAANLIALADLHPQIMFTSRLLRLIDTGYIILKELNKLYVDHVKTWRLNERHYGLYQGRVKHEVFRELGEDKYKWVRRNFRAVPPLVPLDAIDHSIDDDYDDRYKAEMGESRRLLPRGESLEMVMDRLIPYFRVEILEEQLIVENKTVLVVTHGSIVRSLIKYLNKVDDDAISGVNVPTGVPLVFELDEDLHLIKFYYLDKEAAERGIAKVSKEGIEK
ncbi:uncharacterized protein KQ657_001199 [Scheffersomyces spartinae]|uniref:Phosphoglycerate mutase n=1 Tax=Scheffersomyces spartinae TaxID=45513 RepID=A0A9P7V880_9ASCO|nr:uncharacterized protein KQ657_001199 [Scheffersomyces spartinae]KAG7193082.1 hypothetical protein KQ657_001199 [Scheffersomyces spartinae]